MTISALATVVRVTASMKHVNIVQNIAPETMPGQPAARTTAHASRRRVKARIPAIETAAKKLRQNVTSQLCAWSSQRATRPAVLQSTLAPTIHATARAWVIRSSCASPAIIPGIRAAASRRGEPVPPIKKRPARMSAPACVPRTAESYLTSRIFIALASVSTDS